MEFDDDLLSQVLRLLLQRDYNTRLVLWGTSLLGAAAGAVGVFTLLRKRALLGDVVSHATLPGVALAYIVMETAWPGQGKSLGGLLVGASLGGLAGVLATAGIGRWTRIREDAALAIVLSVFFGLGISLFTVVQRLPGGNAAGLAGFIYGKAAAMTASDVQSILVVSSVVIGVCLLLYKELAILCFDDRYAAAQGWPVGTLDLLLMAMVVAVTVIGLQSVGLLLVVALLIIPAAAARFWTDHLGTMLLLAAVLGVAMAGGGVAVSAVVPRVATGAVIVLAGTALFGMSLLMGVRRGLLRRVLAHRRAQRRAQEEHLLRAIYEQLETRAAQAGARDIAEGETSPFEERVALGALLPLRAWSLVQLRRLLQRGARRGQMVWTGDLVGLTSRGLAEARRLVRNHRLWELYLIHYADTAPALVDRHADRMEHFLDAELLADLETKLAAGFPELRLPESPHEG
jgi:manganese/zinc/iron transport system permease protein